jgi:lipopolysaccharide/colanic/teichoic acid biosynthesis glycosyltransferase
MCCIYVIRLRIFIGIKVKMKQAFYFFMKRLMDVLLSILGLMLTSPILLPVMFLVWKQDKHSPFYVAERIGKDSKPFNMVKLRSMIKNADTSGVDSTSVNDMRITPIGQFIRRYKLDELTQLWNVLLGDMSLVGPRPNVRRETDLYTTEEQRLLSFKPGITDFASIVFSDEGEILSGQKDPDLAYNQLIRPGKSRLGLFYLEAATLQTDIALLFLTVVAILSRQKALALNAGYLRLIKAPEGLVKIAVRDTPLTPTPPPGSVSIVSSRDTK